jgi:hypothetical protein
VSVGRLPVAQYPEIAPPVVRVSGQYPGASADVVAATVVAPLEQQINGVENMIYMTSNSTGDGRFQIDVTLELGTNLDIAQVQVQNRVAIAQPRIPADVRNIGFTTAKSSPDLMMVVHLYSPDKSRDPLFISYATVGRPAEPHGWRIYLFGAGYSMSLGGPAALGLTTRDVVTACKAGASVLPACSTSRRWPNARSNSDYTDARTAGRPIRDRGQQSATAVVRLRTWAGSRLARSVLDQFLSRSRSGSCSPSTSCRGVFALATTEKIKSMDDELSKKFPSGLEYTIIYNPTEFIQQSIDACRAIAGRYWSSGGHLFCRLGAPPLFDVATPVSSAFFMAIFRFRSTTCRCSAWFFAIRNHYRQSIVSIGLSPKLLHVMPKRTMVGVGSALIAIAGVRRHPHRTYRTSTGSRSPSPVRRSSLSSCIDAIAAMCALS